MTSDSAFFLLSRSHTRECRTRELTRKAGESRRRHARSWKCGTFGNVLLSHSLKRGFYGRRASLKRNSSATHARLSGARAGLTLLFRARSPSSGWTMLGKCCCYWCSCYFHSCTRELLTFRHNHALHFNFRPFFTCQSKIFIHSCLYQVDRNVSLFMHSNFH